MRGEVAAAWLAVDWGRSLEPLGFSWGSVAVSQYKVLPVLQVVAAGLNFLFVVFTGRGHFTLPFKSIDEVMAATHFPARASGEVARGGVGQ